jgi:DtxR family Mn-dependent transcriptional regulator
MSEPLLYLVIAFFIMSVALVFLWPGKGIIPKWKNARRLSLRVLAEDSLKHIYDYEYRNLSCTINSLAGNLSISADDAAQLVSRLEAMGLITSSDNKLQLSPAGRSYALRVIRIHRLWEKYFADETSLEDILWHPEAEIREHTTTPEEANQLAAQLGNPVFDPHGDPIPTQQGELPVRKGRPLTSLKDGEAAQIIHIEDEPQAVYAQLVAEGLYAGIHIRKIESSKERIRLEANGEECVLAPMFANNISVAPVPEYVNIENYRTLGSLNLGEEAVVLGIAKACRGQQRRRLMDLGVVPGTIIKAELKSAGGDPFAYRIKGASIALRKKQANQIYIKEKNEVEYATA